MNLADIENVVDVVELVAVNCPFCKSETTEPITTVGFFSTSHRVICRKCGTHGPAHTDPAPVEHSHPEYHIRRIINRNKAIKSWNQCAPIVVLEN